MVRRIIVTFLICLACSSSSADNNWQTFDGSDVYPVRDKSKCIFPFTYNLQTYHDCTNDGSNGNLPWCSVSPVYSGVFAYCYDFRKTNLTCQPSYTINGKGYTGCSLLSKSAAYKQCKTTNPNYAYMYCPDAMYTTSTKGLTLNPKCNPAYATLSPFHTACFYPSDYAIPIPISDDDKQALLDMHNSYRSAVPSAYMFQLYWDDELANLAGARGGLCGFDHDLAENRLSPLYNWKNGQNMVMSTEIRSSLDSLIDMMLGSEQPNFVYGVGCNPAGTCLHYTQAMISNLTRVGCAHTHCVYPDRIERFLTCNFIQSQYASKYMIPYVPDNNAASACRSKNVNGLCDCGPKICKYDQNEYLHPDTCVCRKDLSKRSLEKRDIHERALDGGSAFIAAPAGPVLTDERKKRSVHTLSKNGLGRKPYVEDPTEDGNAEVDANKRGFRVLKDNGVGGKFTN